MKILISCALAVLLSLVSGSSLAQVEVFDDQANFVNATGATLIPIPSAATAFPSAQPNSCGVSQSGTADSRLERSTTAKIEINFEVGNKITLTQDLSAPGNGAVGLCVLDDGHERTTGNTNPSLMIANTIVGNGEDDYLITFENPVHAVGFRLLTNGSANEIVYLYDAAANLIPPSQNVDGLTAPNTRQFVGFKSLTPIKSVLIDTSGGAAQNEGIDEIKIAENVDICPDTEADHPTRGLGKNRWIWDDDVWVTTESNGRGPDKSFTMEETQGCSCEQILDTLVDKTDRSFDGHYKFGCSSSVVEDWISGRYYMETVNVQAADAIAVASDMTLKSTENYHLMAYRHADAQNKFGQPEIPFDAKYSVTTEEGENPLEPTHWTDLVTGYVGYGPQLLDLHVDGANIDWGAFNPAHVYWYDKPGTGAPVTLWIYDVYYPNNAGFLSVDIFVKLW